MPKLIVQFEDRVLSECVIGPQGVTIGRLPGNHVVIDNPAVSSFHARVIRDGLRCILEDLQSTNRTFVNDKAVTQHELRSGDVVTIGKHTLLFDGRATEEPVEATPVETVPELGGTMVLDTKQQRALLAKMEEEAQARRRQPHRRQLHRLRPRRRLASAGCACCQAAPIRRSTTSRPTPRSSESPTPRSCV
jgi:pSer/pThr/pTyr-binding forkhead associated (FHA) protein